MSSFARKAPLILIGIGAGVTANATVIYGGGGSYTVEAPINDNVQVIEGAHLVVGSGGRITGVASSEWLQGAVRVDGGTLDVVGNGQINAGGNANAINFTGSRLVRLNDQARVTGNIVNLFTSPGWEDESTATSRLYVSDRAIVDGNIDYAGYLRVEDQATILGDVRNQDSGSYNLDLRGGVVGGTIHMHGINGYVLNMEGGAILGGVDARNSYAVELTMSGGYIGNGLRVDGFASVDGEIRGGQIDGGIVVDSFDSYPASDLTISGGQFNANAEDWLLYFSDNTTFNTRYSHLSIWGGQFGYQDPGLGFFIDNRVDFDIHGRDLLFADGWLTGYLLDGSWLSTGLTFGSGWSGTFTIHNVPEPGTMGLLLASMLGMFAFRRTRV